MRGRIAGLCLLSLVSLAARAAPGDLEPVALTPAGTPNVGYSEPADVSAGGRFVMFAAEDSGLVAGDTNGFSDMFVRDRVTGVIQRVSVSNSGVQANRNTGSGRITPDGRFVVFWSPASNLVAGDSNTGASRNEYYSGSDIFLYDRQASKLELVSRAPNGQQPSEMSLSPSVSDDGRYVAFYAEGSNLGLPGEMPRGIFVRDRQTGTTELASVSSSGTPADGAATFSDLSGDGRYVAFISYDPNLVPNDTNGHGDAYVHDRQTGVTELVSLRSNGSQFDSSALDIAITADGRYVAFELLSGGIWLRDRWNGTTELVTLTSTGAPATGGRPSISADGRYVTFETFDRLTGDDTDSSNDVFRRDRLTGVTQLVSRSAGSGNFENSLYGYISPDGNYVAFGTYAAYSAGDTDGDLDAYIAELGEGQPPGNYGFTVRPGAYDFGSQAIGTSRTFTFWMHNTGERDLPIERIYLGGTNAGQFFVWTRCGSSLGVDASCAIKVRFTPTSLGNKSAWVRVVAGEGMVRTRNVTGIGVAPTP